ncbi:hypothetical protein KC19_12G176000, partial [Ceratodon purpureus]
GVDGKDKLAKFCEGRLVYVYNISDVYNRKFVRECATFKKGRDLCMYMENGGMGRGFSLGGRPPGEAGAPWYNTWQFALELYFHKRLLRHPCVTDRAELANAFFVPYYAGMDLSRRFTHRLAKGELYMELARWLQGQESWKRRQGRDHFMMLGRIASDFYRQGEDPRLWGNEMLLQRAFKKMIKLTIERSSIRPDNDKEIAIPYPTYYHPSSDSQIQNIVDGISQGSQRNSLVTMAAGQRRPSVNSMRFKLMNQCENDPRCTLLLCEGNEASPGLLDGVLNPPSPVKLTGKTLNMSCNNPAILLGAMHQSQFCLQPPGDSPTRRSFFDAMLAGCIPVIFSKDAAWTQYVHHLPNDGASYSVFIPMKVASKSNVINILGRIREPEIRKMQRNIAKLLPSILYGHVRREYSPKSPAGTMDAFEIALTAVLEKMKAENQHNQDIE